MTTTERTEPTDDQIREQIQEHWTTEFSNWSGDPLNEAVMDLAVGDTEQDEERVYDRACALLTGAKITVVWPGAPNPVAAELRRQSALVQARREEDLETADYRWFRDHLADRADEIERDEATSREG